MNSHPRSLFEVFIAFLKLGLTSFGGPIAHLGFYRETFVVRKKWIDEKFYADLVALCQFLPGPASSQVSIGIGLSQAGLPGAFAAWIAFTAPSAILMILFGFGIVGFSDTIPDGLLHGLKVVAVAVVAQAVWGMAKSHCSDNIRISIAILSTITVVAAPTPWVQILVILAGAVVGTLFLKAEDKSDDIAFKIAVSKPLALFCVFTFFGLLIGLPLALQFAPSQELALIDSFYRSGSLVFGGGHVVLPLLQSETVLPGWVSNDMFLAGYGAAQAVPGPLFTFAAYLGTVMGPEPNGLIGALICLVAIFASSFLLVIGILPFWENFRHEMRVQKALLGVNASVVGLLLAALYNPVWTSGILNPTDFALGVAAFGLLQFWKIAPWAVVGIGAAGGWALSLLA